MLNVTEFCTSTKSIDKRQLENILDTIIGNASDDSTFATPNHFDNVYKNPEDTYMYQAMHSQLGDDMNIWTNHAPCPMCIDYLISEYKIKKPTIHIARLLNVNESQDYNKTTQTLRCLAKLACNNFTISAWDIEEFRAPFDTQANGNCSTVIQNYSQNDKFTVALLRMDRYIDRVNKIKPSSASCT